MTPLKTKSGTNFGDVQEMNRALVIDLLRQRHLCSRVQLANATGLKKTTITNIVSDLMEWGLIRETGKLVGEKGRRAVGIELDYDRFKVLCVRIARRFFHVMLVDILGNVCDKQTEEILPSQTPEQVVQRIKDVLQGYLEQQNGYRILGIGMGAPGPILFRQGRIAYNLDEFPGWERVLVLEEFTGVLGVPFFFDHDANVGALAEWRYGSFARRSGIMVYVAAGDGIGGGVVIDGKIQRGSQGFFGEIGHTSINFTGERCGCGSRGCLDRYASGTHLMGEVKKSLPNYPGSLLHHVEKLNVGSIIEAMRQGDVLATEKISSISWHLGIGIVNIINTYDPDIIIIGDELSTVGELLLNTVRAVVKDHVLPEIYKNIRIELSSLQDDPILLGAAALTLDNLMAQPTSIFTAGEAEDKDEASTIIE